MSRLSETTDARAGGFLCKCDLSRPVAFFADTDFG